MKGEIYAFAEWPRKDGTLPELQGQVVLFLLRPQSAGIEDARPVAIHDGIPARLAAVCRGGFSARRFHPLSRARQTFRHLQSGEDLDSEDCPAWRGVGLELRGLREAVSGHRRDA